MQTMLLDGALGAGSRLAERLRSAVSPVFSGLRLVAAAFAEAREMRRDARRRFHFLDD
jgi:hypothetical protein